MLLNNQIITASLISWFIAQVLKVILTLIVEKKFNFRRFIGSGGMPSSHSALVVAMTTSVGKVEGIDSALFGISLVFSLIVMYDAAGIRRAAGKQAQVLNKIVKEIYETRHVVQDRLIELLGHTPVEVFAGAILGIIIGLFV